MAKSYRTANIRVSAVNGTKHDGLVTYKKSDVCGQLKDWSTTADFTYWMIRHEADDEDPNIHFHIIIKFKSPVHFETIKNRFPYGYIESTRNLRNSVQYLIHANDKSKKQYEWDDIVTNCMDMSPYKVQSSFQQAVTLESIYEAIKVGEIREYNLYEKVPISLFAGNKIKIDNALTWYRENVMLRKDRNITVIFMSGPTGIGKTTFAKKFCETRHLRYCMSSSSNDPLQDYKGEPVLIMDDLRDDAFKFHDIIKLLDNHTLSTSKSRYHNKGFIGDIIIITSTKPVNDWYFSKPPEQKHELYRRVRQWCRFDGERIYVYEYSDKTKRYEPRGSAPNPFIMEAKKRAEMAMKIFDGMGVEFTPADREYIQTSFENMSDEEFRKEFCEENSSIPEATEEEKEARKHYEDSLPPVDFEKVNKRRVG